MAKVSEITVKELSEFIRLDDPTETELSELARMKQAAISFIKSYTGIGDEELDSHDEIAQALFVLVADMFDNRNLYVEGKASNINKMVENILAMHSTNLL